MNRLRALVGGFATGNATQFNRPDGAGYAFLARVVTDTDPRNPQVAARLLQAFRSWRALEGGRRSLAKAALERVAGVAGLSPDVRDIVDRNVTRHVARQRAYTVGMNDTLADAFVRRGMTVTRADIATFKAKLKADGFYRRWRERVGAKAWSLLEQEVGAVG